MLMRAAFHIKCLLLILCYLLTKNPYTFLFLIHNASLGLRHQLVTWNCIRLIFSSSPSSSFCLPMSFFICPHGSRTEHDCACTFSGSFQGTNCFVQFCLAAALFRTASPHFAFLSARWKWLSLLSPFFLVMQGQHWRDCVWAKSAAAVCTLPQMNSYSAE